MKFSAVKSSSLNCRVPLLLHFDINKTIIITDSALDLKTDQALNSLLSECIWGTLKKNRFQCEAGNTSGLRAEKITDVELHPRSYLKTGTRNENNNSDDDVDSYKWSVSDWKICSPLPSKNAPQADSVTFNEFVENFHFDEKMTKTERRQFKRRFTEKGMPGEEALESFQMLEKSMKFPPQEFGRDKNRDSNNLDKKIESKTSLGIVGDQNRGNTDGDNSKNAENNNSSNNENKSSANEDDSTDEITDKKRKIDLIDSVMESSVEHISVSNMRQILKSGHYHILPSFFKLVSYLHQLQVDFRIIFRTFGIDVEKVSEEFNIYCDGKHPLFPINEKESVISVGDKITEISNNSDYHPVERVRMNGENGIDRRLHFPYFCGAIKRTSEGPDGMSLSHTNILGEVETVHGSREIFQTINEWFRSSTSNTEGEGNDENTNDKIKNSKNTSCEVENEEDKNKNKIENGVGNGENIDSTFSPFTVAIQDDFYYWDACGESDESGKLFMVDVEKRENRDFESVIGNGERNLDEKLINEKNVKITELASNIAKPIQIFFDDNVERFRSHIVDVRTASTFEPIPFKTSENVFIKKVETYFAITDEDYYIDLVEEMVTAQIKFNEIYHD